MPEQAIVLRLAAPMQSWGSSSRFNRRTTDDRPTKSGVVGLLAAATGRLRGEPIEDLVNLRLGVRVDQPGTLLSDYHTVSTLDGSPLLSASTSAKGAQKKTPKKFTHVTRRQYLQDSVFVAVVGGERDFLAGLAEAIRRPAFPLALGRRACVPTQPLLVKSATGDLWDGSVVDVLNAVSWQAGQAWRRVMRGRARLAATFDDIDGEDVVRDVPVSFEPRQRSTGSRRVSHTWVTVDDAEFADATPANHDPFELLGW